MKRLVLVTILTMLLCSLMWSAAVKESPDSRPLYAPNLIKVKLSAEAIGRAALPQGLYAETRNFGINELDQILTRIGGSAVIRAHRRVRDTAWETATGFDRWFLIRLDGRAGVESAITAFKANRYIEDASPEYIAYTQAVPNDTYYNYNWGHNNTAQLPVYQGGSHSGAGVGTVGFDSRAQLAWDQTQGYGSSSVVIAIIDSGVDTAHPDLLLVTGYDYGDNDSNPMDNSADPGHGTSCAGIAAGRANNSLGIAGVAGGCSVMPLKVANSNGDMYFTAIDNAITHAADNGADVISMSLGAEGGMGEGDSATTDAALYYAYNAGVVILAATANANAAAIAYPSNHTAVISVGAASPTGQRKSTTSSDGENWWGSNYGVNIQDDKEAVDIMAATILPATDLVGSVGYSTTDYYMWFNGTSCATPYAAGVAALLLSKSPSLSPAQVRTAITSTATDMTIDGGAGWDRYTGYGMINAYAALNSLVPGLPVCQITAPANGSTHNLNSTINVTVNASDEDGTITKVEFFVDGSPTPSYTDYSSPYQWSWETTGLSGGTHTLTAVATDNSSNTAQQQITITLLAPADEGFESGNFSAFAWANNSSIPWTVQSSEKYSGTYAAKSGAISHNSNTSLSLTLNVTSAGNVSFYRRVSSESGYDFLKFYIDDVETGSWAGEAAWGMQSYPVTAGSRTFRWTYSKDVSDNGGSDCAWLDHIVFPPFSVYYAPPQNLAAVGGNAIVNLTWSAPSGGTPTGYKIFRNSNLLTTVTGLSYADNAVINGVNYSYYLTAVYSGGESAATATVNATPSDQTATEAVLGTGTTSTGTQDGCPINIYYKSLHGQSVYTAAELSAAGVVGPINITAIGFYVNSVPTLALPSFTVRMGHTSASNVASWIPSTGLTNVYTNASYMPTAGGFHMLTLSTPFLWNGVDNIVIDTAFNMVSNYSSTGTVRYTSVSNGYRFVRSDTANQSSIFTGGSVTAFRPNVRMTFATLNVDPQIMVDPTSLSYGNVAVGSNAVKNITIYNTGGGTLSGNISTPDAYTVSSAGSKSTTRAAGMRNTLPFSIGAGLSASFTITFSPTSEQAYNGNITITHNAGGADRSVSVSGNGLNPRQIPFAEGFENGLNNWQPVNEVQVNYWVAGSATANTGVQSAYVSNDGTTNAYTIGSAAISHLFRDVSFPGTGDSFKLRFAWKGQGEGSTTQYDYLRVYLTDVTYVPIAGSLPPSGQLGVSYNLSTDWQEVTLNLPAGLNSSIKRLIFTWVNDSSLGTQPPAAIDDIRIVVGNDSDAAVVIDGDYVVTPPPVTDPESNPIAPVVNISNLAGNPEYIVVITGYAIPEVPNPNAGLCLSFYGANFANSTITINHGLGWIPLAVRYKLGGNWILLENPGTWTSNSCSFTVLATKAGEDLIVAFPNNSESTLPVTLSSFTAVINAGSFVRLDWVTQSESGMQGFYLYRGTETDAQTAQLISDLIPATNTSQVQSYTYADSETETETQYYYWLQSVDLDGQEQFFGPVSIISSPSDDGTPGIPLISELRAAYPNPFNPSTTLSYCLKAADTARMDIFNLKGQVVRTFTRQHNDAGIYTLVFDGCDANGRPLASGVYYYRLTLRDYSATKKMILLK